jgi:hypothetical protein
VNTILTQASEQTINAEKTDTQPSLTELKSVELAYVGGGMANVAFQ